MHVLIIKQNDMQRVLYPLSALTAPSTDRKTLIALKWILKPRKKVLSKSVLPQPRLLRKQLRHFLKIKQLTIKRSKSSAISEFKSKGNKIRYEANSNILEKIDDAINSIQKGNINRWEQKLDEGKALILIQQKLVSRVDRKEDGWKVVNCYLSDDMASDSEDEKH